MRRMTCENGFVFVAAICMGLMVTSARGGTNLFPSAGPTNPASAMWTLNDIYNKLNTRAAVSKRPDAFFEPSGGPTNGTMRTLNEIMTLVTNRAPVPKTGQTISQAPHDDGWYSTNVGVAWPNPRFTIGTGADGTNCVTDNFTGLIWARNANIASNVNFNPTWSSVAGTCTWYQAFDVITNGAGPVNGANYGGANDWRMPNWNELFSLIDFRWSSPALCNTAGTAKMTPGEPFTGVQNSPYWMSITRMSSPNDTWYVNLGNSIVYSILKTQTWYVWPVRGGQ